VTGSIIALLGKADEQGYYIVEDSCKAGVAFKPELPACIDTNIHRGLFEGESRKFVALASGFLFGGLGDLEDV